MHKLGNNAPSKQKGNETSNQDIVVWMLVILGYLTFTFGMIALTSENNCKLTLCERNGNFTIDPKCIDGNLPFDTKAGIANPVKEFCGNITLGLFGNFTEAVKHGCECAMSKWYTQGPRG